MMKESPAEDAKTYMSTRQVPQLFESLMTGLMYHRPDDHIGYLIDCLQKVKDSGSSTVNWNSFVEFKRSNSLPPISATPTRDSSSDEVSSATPVHRDASHRIAKTSPLPPIGKSRETTIARTSPVKIPATVPVVLMMGPPGSGKLTQCQRVLQHYTKYRWVHLSIGDMLRQQMLKNGDAEQRWQVVAELIQKGEMAPQDVTQSLIKEALKEHLNADGILISGYPRTMEQVDEFNRIVGRVDLVILLDCEEEMCSQRLMARRQDSERIDDNDRAVQRRVEFFKQNTLPVVQYFESEGKLVPLTGDRDSDVLFYDIANIIDVAFYGRKPGYYIQQYPPLENIIKEIQAAGTGTSSVVIQSRSPTQLSPTPVKKRKSTPSSPSSFIMMNKDEGRKEGLPQVPIFFLMGGPGSGKGSQSERLEQRFPGLVHLSMGEIIRNEIATNGTAHEKIDMICDLVYKGEMAPKDFAIDLLIANMKKNSSAKGFLIEGFPRTKEQVEDFNAQIGGLVKAILLDCEEETLIKNVEARREETGRQDDRPAPLKRRVEFYKNNTLRLVKYFQDREKLTVVTVDKKSVDDIHAEISSEMNFIFHSSPSSTKTDLSKEKTEVDEDVIQPQTAYTTGGGSRDSTSLTKYSSEESKEPTSISKEQSELNKEQTEVKKQQTDVSKSSSDSDPSTVPSKQPTVVAADEQAMAELSGKKVIFVVGGPGCGKGTQCAKIVEKYGFCHLSSGDLLREEVQSGSERGKEMNAIMESGALVSMDVVLALLKEAMLKNTSAKGFLIDGYPRELEQGTRFEAELVPPACVLYFEVPDDVMVERLLDRAKTSGRVDDNEETIQKRLKTFHDHCDQVLAHYKSKNLLCKIDARGQVDDIFGEVVKSIDATN